jgi:hypothetical protein
MFFKIHAGFSDGDTLGFKKLSLQRSDGFANQKFAAVSDDTMPGYSFSRGSCRHGSSNRSRAAPQVQSFSECAISSNPPTRDLFHQSVDRIPSHCESEMVVGKGSQSKHSDLCAGKVFDFTESAKGRIGAGWVPEETQMEHSEKNNEAREPKMRKDGPRGESGNDYSQAASKRIDCCSGTFLHYR